MKKSEKVILTRCLKLLTTIAIEAEKIPFVSNDSKAKTMAMLKINIMYHVMEIWPNGNAFRQDIDEITSILEKD